MSVYYGPNPERVNMSMLLTARALDDRERAFPGAPPSDGLCNGWEHAGS